ncbi:hypothetical protein KR093_010297, partial [Drosophila rubida]
NTSSIMKLSMFESPNCLLSRRNRYQFLATFLGKPKCNSCCSQIHFHNFLVNISTFSHGVGIGWMSPVMRDLQSPESPLSFKVIVEEISWIGSLLGIGSLIGNLLAGFLQDRIGRKPVLYFLAIPYLCFWLLAYFAQSVEYLYAGRLLAGITGGGGYIVLPIFISEISDAKIRGRLGSMVMLSVNVGVLAGYILSTNVNYFVAPFFIIPLPICYLVGNLFLPETPFHLINKGKLGAAEKSFRFYKNINEGDKTSMVEFEEIKLKLTKEQALKVNSFNYKDFITKPAFKGYATAMVMLCSNQFTGTFCFTTYMTDIFEISHASLDPGLSTIILGTVQIVGVCATILFCDRYGRKFLLMISSLGASICLAAFGFYIYFAERYDLSALGWIPLVLLTLEMFLCHIGLVGIFFVVLVEAMPARIRSVAVSAFVVLLSCFVFLTLKIFPLCLKNWGLDVTMWAASAVGLLGFIYFSLCFVETKGKSMLDN